MQVAKYEDTLNHLQAQVEKSQGQCKRTHGELSQEQTIVHSLKVQVVRAPYICIVFNFMEFYVRRCLILQLTSLQANHKETFEQLSEKTRHVASLKNEIERVNQRNHALTEEVRFLSFLCGVTCLLSDEC